MIIDYVNNSVKRYFTDFDFMKKKTEHTRTIKKRIDQIKASECFYDYLKLGLGKPHLLHGSLSDCYGISVSGNVRLIVRPVCEDFTPKSLKACRVIIVKGVADYHGRKINWFIP